MPKTAARPSPAPSSQLTAAQFFAQQIEKSGKSQTEIASELGFPNPNVITMFKQGRTKIPLNRVPDIARVLECDPLHMMRVVMSEYTPETWQVFERVLGRNLVTEAEMEILKTVREASSEQEISPKTDEQKRQLKDLIKSWKDAEPKVIRHS